MFHQSESLPAYRRREKIRRAIEILEAPAQNKAFLNHSQNVIEEANAQTKLANKPKLQVIR